MISGFRIVLAGAVLPALLFGGIALSGPARADEPAVIAVTIKDHKFTPSEIHVVTAKPTILAVKNEDSTSEEFDSSALKVEKVIAPGATANIRLRPLGRGKYPFMGEYHSDTAQGAVISE